MLHKKDYTPVFKVAEKWFLYNVFITFDTVKWHENSLDLNCFCNIGTVSEIGQSIQEWDK